MKLLVGRPLAWLLLAMSLSSEPLLASASPPDFAAVIAAVEEYHEGLRRSAPSRVSAVLGPSFTMFNGNFSGDPRTWEVHMYLAGPRLTEWPVNFLQQAGPYENEVRVIRVHLRGDAGLVVTEESGQEPVPPMGPGIGGLPARAGGGRWRLVGYFIRDIANPK